MIEARSFAFALLLGAFASQAAAGSNTAVVTVTIREINELSLDGAPSLLVESTTAGSEPDDATAEGTYNVTTNETGRKITGSLDAPLPGGLVLKVNLAAPPGATSGGDVALTSTAVDLVTGITRQFKSGGAITYTLQARMAAGVVPPTTRVVTLTIQ